MKDCIKSKKIEWGQFLMLCIVLLITCIFFNRSGYNIGRLFVLLLVIGAFFLNIEKILFLMMFCLPFSGVLKLGENSITIIPILYIIAIVKTIMQHEEKYEITIIFAIGVFAFIQILSCVVYNANLFSIISFLLSVAFVFIIGRYFLKQAWNDGYLLKNIVLFYVASVCFETIISDIFPNIPYYISAEKHALLVNAGRFAALNIDPNEYAQYVLIALGLIIAVIPIVKRWSVKILCCMFAIFLGYRGFFTYSKSYALTLLLLFIIFSGLFLFKFIKKNKRDALIIVIPLLILYFIGGYFIFENILKPIFEKRAGDDLLTGRGDIWKYYINEIFSRVDCLIFGCGASNTLYLGSEIKYVPHNLYIEYFVQFGLLGIFLLVVIFMDSLRNIFRKLRSYIIIPVLAFAITSFGVSANANDMIFLILVIVCIPYQINKEGNAIC